VGGLALFRLWPWELTKSTDRRQFCCENVQKSEKSGYWCSNHSIAAKRPPLAEQWTRIRVKEFDYGADGVENR
jgi:hypothetical protein